MSTTPDTPLARLTAALDELADALASADLPRLLAAEPSLAAALDGMVGTSGADRQTIERARGALLRCSRLGAGLVTFTRLTLDPDGAREYSRHGGAGTTPRPNDTLRGLSMEARG